MDYESWSALSDAELAKRDIAEINLLAANGLPGAKDLDISAFLGRADEWASLVGDAIKRTWKRRVNGAYSDLTGNQFRILVMVTILQRDLGVRYNRKLLDGEYDARDPRNLFIHGPLSGHGGTCASLPFLYLAIGRRLGFPLFLAEASEHLFVRWDGDGERFNIEATAQGFEPYDDAHFRSYPRPLSQTQIKDCPHYLKSMTPREELACCLSQRAKVWFDNLNLPEGIQAMHFANQLCSFYHGAWAAMTMAFMIVSRMRKLDRSLPWETLINLATPQPRTRIEAWALGVAKLELIRQYKIRAQDRASAHDEIFNNAKMEPLHV